MNEGEILAVFAFQQAKSYPPGVFRWWLAAPVIRGLLSMLVITLYDLGPDKTVFAKKTKKSDFKLAFLVRSGYTNSVDTAWGGDRPLAIERFSGNTFGLLLFQMWTLN
jgi:hypothetical protein